MKVVLDSNVVVSGIFWKGTPGLVLDVLVEDEFVLVASQEILLEYERVIDFFGQKRKMEEAFLNKWKSLLWRKCEVIHPEKSPLLCRDPDDQKFLDTAFSAWVDYLVSGDGDLLDLREEALIRIVSPGEFLRREK